MRVVFFGTSEYAVSSLEELIQSSYKIAAVVTQPDRKKGRGLSLTSPAVKIIAKKHSLNLYQFEDVNTKESLEVLKGLKADLFVVVSFGQILSREVLDIPRLYTINLHFSLLPKYRGAAPVQRAIISGEQATGATIIKLTENMDAGDIILRKEVKIPEDETADSLGKRLSFEGASLLVEAVELIKSGETKFTPQDESLVSYAPKFRGKDERLINWDDSSAKIHNLVRGLYSHYHAFIYFNGKQLKICRTRRISDAESSSAPGTVIEIKRDGLIVGTGDGLIAVERVQLEGKKEMDAYDFAQGARLKSGDVMGN